MKLVICEKSSLAKNCQKGLFLLGEQFNTKQGYAESDNYIVTYCRGHLLGLYDVDDYVEEKGYAWKLDNLPYIPHEFKLKFNVDQQVKTTKPNEQQFEIIQKLLKRKDVTEVVHFGDADREGECIVRNCVYRAVGRIPMKRVWVDAQTETDIAEAFKHLKDDSEFDSLYEEGITRRDMDWLLGINLTSFLTCVSGGYPLEKNQRYKVLRVGRVLLPIVKKVYDVDMSIRNFVPQTYYQADGKGEKDGISFSLVVKNDKEPRKSKSDVDDIVGVLNNGSCIVTDIIQKDKKLARPKLFNLGTAQVAILKKHKISLDDSMAAIQNLYLGGYLSYPRTNTEYLADTEKDTVKKVIKALAERDFDVAFHESKTVFDTSKVESHSALIPTYKIPEKFSNETEEKVYEVIRNRFCATFCAEDCIVSETVATIENSTYVFKVKGQATKQSGFLKYDNTKKKDNEIPQFKKGERLSVVFECVEKKTSPPGKLNVDQMDKYLDNPFKKHTDTEDEEYKAILEGASIGTQATRTAIIHNAVESEYISLSKEGIFSILPRGEFLISICDQLGVKLYAERTVEFGKILKKVNKGTSTYQECIDMVSQELNSVITDCDKDVVEQLKSNIPKMEQQILGKCPHCNENSVVHGRFGFYCKNCAKEPDSFTWSSQKKLLGVDVTNSMMQAFLAKKKVFVKGLQGKEKKFDAYIVPKEFIPMSYKKKDGTEGTGYDLKFEFEFKKKKGRK